jgi:hypothetical protein
MAEWGELYHPPTPRIISRTRTPIPAATATTSSPIIR